MMIIVFPQPVVEFMMGQILFLAELLLRLAAAFPYLDQRKH